MSDSDDRSSIEAGGKNNINYREAFQASTCSFRWGVIIRKLDLSYPAERFLVRRDVRSILNILSESSFSEHKKERAHAFSPSPCHEASKASLTCLDKVSMNPA
jgi:hypothetical protein